MEEYRDRKEVKADITGRSYVVKANSKFAKETSKKSHEEAKKLLEVCDEFLLIAQKGTGITLVSAMTQPNIRFFTRATEDWKKEALRLKTKVETEEGKNPIEALEENWEDFFTKGEGEKNNG